MSFAFGMLPSVARIGSVLNGPTVNAIADSYSVGSAFLVGFFICIFCLLLAIILVLLDKYAEQKDNMKTQLDENEKFKWSDIVSFKTPFWLLCGCSVLEYMVIMVYVGNAENMLVEKFAFTER